MDGKLTHFLARRTGTRWVRQSSRQRSSAAEVGWEQRQTKRLDLGPDHSLQLRRQQQQQRRRRRRRRCVGCSCCLDEAGRLLRRIFAQCSSKGTRRVRPACRANGFKKKWGLHIASVQRWRRELHDMKNRTFQSFDVLMTEALFPLTTSRHCMHINHEAT
jgi:hypothetical protein